MSLTNEMRYLTVHNTNNIINNNVQKSINNNQPTSSKQTKKINPIQPEIVNPPVLKKVKHEEHQVKSIKTEKPNSQEIKPFFSQGAKKTDETKQNKNNSKKDNNKCNVMEEEEECYYGDVAPNILDQKNKVETKETEKMENPVSEPKIIEPPKTLFQPKKIEMASQESKINCNNIT